MKGFLKKYSFEMLVLVLSLPAVYYLLIPGFYEPHDLHHIADIYQMYRAFSSGQLPPRWGPDFLYAYGYPLFNFYYLLPFYLGAAFFAIFGHLQVSFEFVFIVSVFLSSLGMYAFLRQYFGKLAALTGALLFLYTPYRAVQIYVRGAMGEAVALSLLPWIGFVLVRLLRKPDRRNVAFASVVTGVFILSHNYFWVLSAPFLLGLLAVESKSVGKAIPALCTTAIIALGISAYWWIPAISEQGLVSSVTPFPLIDHFPFIKQLILPSWGYGSSVWGPGDGISFQIGVVNLAVVGALLMVLVLSKKLRAKSKTVFRVAIWSLTGFAIAVFFMNIRSYPIWKMVPFHDFIQFPWRLLYLTTFFTAVMAAVITEVIKNHQRFFGAAIIIAAFMATLCYFKPSKLFYKSDDDYLARFFANRTLAGEKTEVASAYLNYSEDYLLLPNGIDGKPSSLPAAKIVSSDASVWDIRQNSAVDWSARVESETDAVVYFNSLYFPGWSAQVDGEKVDSYAAASNPIFNGGVAVSVSAGSHSVRFYWQETPLRKAADYISLVSLVLCVGLLVKKKK